MDDKRLTELLWERSETVLEEIRDRYGAYCRFIARQILGSEEDAEEVENDAVLKLWRTVPPAKPASLRSYLGMLARQIAVDKRRSDPKRRLPEDAFLESLDELEDALPFGGEDRIVNELALRDGITRFLEGLRPKERRIFLQRYWYACPVRQIAESEGCSEAAVKMRLMRMRGRLRDFLEEEDLWYE